MRGGGGDTRVEAVLGSFLYIIIIPPVLNSQMEDQLKNPQKKEKKKKPKINDYQMGDDRRGMTRPMRSVPEFHKRKGQLNCLIHPVVSVMASLR